MSKREIKQGDEIPIKWRRSQAVWKGRYDTFKQFLNAMISEYRHKLENNLGIAAHTLITYNDKNIIIDDSRNNRGMTDSIRSEYSGGQYLQIIEAFPTKEQQYMLNEFMKVWIKSYEARYYFIVHHGMVKGKASLGYISGSLRATSYGYDSVLGIITRGEHDTGQVRDYEKRYEWI